MKRGASPAPQPSNRIITTHTLMPASSHYSNDIVREYLNEIGRTPLLSAEEEIELGHLVQAGLKPDATPRQLRAKDRAVSRFIRANLRIVVSIARKYAGRSNHMDILDLIQEGNLGLHHAVLKFDPQRGYKFSTYAYWWIRQAVTRAISDKDRTIRLPGHAYTILGKVLSHPHYSMEQLEELTGKDAAYIRELLYLGQSVASLDAPVKGAPENNLIDALAAETPSELEDWRITENINSVRDALDGIDERQAEVVRLRYGLDDGVPQNLREIGERLGCSRERVRQIHDQGIKAVGLQLAAKRQRNRQPINVFA